jgi:hypothetical protein
MLTIAIGALSNTAEISTSNIRSGAAFDNLKASWNQALKLGDFSTKLRCNYDYNANKEFLKDASLSGDLVEASSDDDVRITYDVSHDFTDKNTQIKLSANTQGTTLSAEYDQGSGVKEVSAERDVDIGDQKVNVQPSWLVKAKTARVKLMSNLGGDTKSAVSAQIDYNTEDQSATYEVGYNRQLEDGRDVAANFKPDKKEVEIDYVDNKFESGATWTAKATVPLEQSNNILDAAKVTLKRSWSW